MTEEPEDLLMARLLRQEKEIEELKIENNAYLSALKFCDDFIAQMIESMPEPVLLREISSGIQDITMREYLCEHANLIDLYRTTLETAKGQMK